MFAHASIKTSTMYCTLPSFLVRLPFSIGTGSEESFCPSDIGILSTSGSGAFSECSAKKSISLYSGELGSL